jgi:hypothetical protein
MEVVDSVVTTTKYNPADMEEVECPTCGPAARNRRHSFSSVGARDVGSHLASVIATNEQQFGFHPFLLENVGGACANNTERT